MDQAWMENTKWRNEIMKKKEQQKDKPLKAVIYIRVNRERKYTFEEKIEYANSILQNMGGRKW